MTTKNIEKLAIETFALSIFVRLLPEQRKRLATLNPEDAKALAEGLKKFALGLGANRALAKFDISRNGLCAAGGKAIVKDLKHNHNMTELNLAGNNLGKVGTQYNAAADMSGVIAISDAIPTMGALVTFDISANSLRAEGGKILAEALKDNNVLTELNISANRLARNEHTQTNMSGVVAISKAIPTMGALTSLNISKNMLLTKEGGKALGDMLKANSVLKELDVSGSEEGICSDELDGPGFVKELVTGVSTNRALVSVNLLKNRISIELAKILVGILKVHPTLMSLCGNMGNETDLNMNYKMDGVQDAILLAPEIAANKALVKLNLVHNGMCCGLHSTESAKAFATALHSNTTLRVLVLSVNAFQPYESQILAGALKTKTTLTKFDISYNSLRADGGKALADALKNNKIMKELNIATTALVENSSDGADMSGVLAICDAIPTMGALTSLNIRGNDIGYLKSSRGWIMNGRGAYCSPSPHGKWQGLSKEGIPDEEFKPVGVIALANAIKNHGALEKLRMGANDLKGIEAGKALGDAIAVNTVLKELDISGDYGTSGETCDAEFVKGFSPGLSTNRAMTKLDISNNAKIDDQIRKRVEQLLERTTTEGGVAEQNERDEHQLVGSNESHEQRVEASELGDWFASILHMGWTS